VGDRRIPSIAAGAAHVARLNYDISQCNICQGNISNDRAAGAECPRNQRPAAAAADKAWRGVPMCRPGGGRRPRGSNESPPRGSTLAGRQAPARGAGAAFPMEVAMLRRIRSLPGLPIVATDGEIGKLKDVYFDDLHWAVRYLVVDTGGWLAGRKVLISPYSVSRIDWEGGGVELRLRKQQVQDSPDIDTDKPVSRQYETDFMRYYGYPDYWRSEEHTSELQSRQ